MTDPGVNSHVDARMGSCAASPPDLRESPQRAFPAAPAPPRLRALRPPATKTPHVPPRVPPGTASDNAPPPAGSELERSLRALGADAAFVEAVFGDLAEERALRAARDGVRAARSWYTREALRSAPHLVRHTVAHGITRGTPRQRARLAAALAGVALTASAAVLAWAVRAGPPAHLVPGAAAGTAGDGLVVNNAGPVRLPVRVFDARGRALAPAGVRWARVSGAAVPVTAAGVVTCTRRGDAVVRASLGALATELVVHCEPVREIHAAGWDAFVLGDPAREVTVDAVGTDGRPATRLAARLRVADGTVVALDGARLRPRRPGYTPVAVTVGEQTTDWLVTVYEPVATLAGLRPDQRFVVAPVRLAPGAALTWPLPPGLFSLSFTAAPPGATAGTAEGTAEGAAGHGAAMPVVLGVAGPIMCMPALRPGLDHTRCLARGAGARLTIAAPAGTGARRVTGSLALHREPDPDAPTPPPSQQWPPPVVR